MNISENITTESAKLVCYCFNYTKNDILEDLNKNGKSTILEKIIQEKQGGNCDCGRKNPKGT